eukprot:CAMPEP_0118651478 /NCGR_PEP_ID=MMETSP0785-20121206/10807_1 /TAXON_ID=91992 /ORGANISM="Bolidomonas pacifica, Strain CCMP 1866" /LENGTH=229 /DNA_ID=CAMNT_0006543933 /DNA_START=44 /DNA_END=730 /DNA_ORIENTATION=+
MGGVAGKYMIDALDADSGSHTHAIIMPSVRILINRDQGYVNRCLTRFKSGSKYAGACPGVSFDEFKHIFGGNKGVLLSLFSSFDTDRNGLVDVQEVLSALILCCNVQPVTKWRMLFELHDENFDNELSEPEIDMMMISCHRGMAKMMSRTHMSNSSIHGIANYMFNAIDRDLNGHIEKAEFMSFVRESPEVTHYFKRIDELRGSVKTVSREITDAKGRKDFRRRYPPRK